MSRTNQYDMELHGVNIFRDVKLVPVVQTLTGDKTIFVGEPVLQVLDANGAARNVTLPAVDGLARFFIITNPAAGAFALTVKDAGATTIGTVAQNKSAIFFSDGAAWYALIGA